MAPAPATRAGGEGLTEPRPVQGRAGGGPARALVAATAVALLAVSALLHPARAHAAGRSLIVLDVDSGVTRTLARSRSGWASLRATPDGRSVLVLRGGFDPRRRNRFVVVVRRRIDLASGRQTRLPVTREGAGSFSPDGTRVLAAARPLDDPDLVLRTLAGRPLARLRPRLRGEGFFGPATWSPDGRLLAVEEGLDAARRRFRLTLVDARSGRVLGARVIVGNEPELGPESFAPSGDRLAVTLRPPVPDPFAGTEAILDLRSAAAAPLAPPRAGFTAPAWSPDGRRIAFPLRGGGVAVLDAATGATERVIPTAGTTGSDVRWSPDGARILYGLVPAGQLCGLSCLFSPGGRPPPAPFEAGLAVADVATGAPRVIVAPGTRTFGDVVWTRDGRGLIAVVEDVRPAARPAAPRRDPGAGAGIRARAAGAAPRAARW